MNKDAFSLSSSLFSNLERSCIEGFDFLSQVSISALDHSHEVLDHTEKFARRLAGIKDSLDKYSEEQRVVLKQQLLAVCRDSVELGQEAIQGLSQLIHLALEEAQELQKNGGEIWQDMKPGLELSNPFRKEPAAVNPPTIIPISIQDN